MLFNEINGIIQEKEEIKCSQETLLVILTDKIETEIKEKDKHRNQAEQFKSEVWYTILQND